MNDWQTGVPHGHCVTTRFSGQLVGIVILDPNISQDVRLIVPSLFLPLWHTVGSLQSI